MDASLAHAVRPGGRRARAVLYSFCTLFCPDERGEGPLSLRRVDLLLPSAKEKIVTNKHATLVMHPPHGKQFGSAHTLLNTLHNPVTGDPPGPDRGLAPKEHVGYNKAPNDVGTGQRARPLPRAGQRIGQQAARCRCTRRCKASPLIDEQEGHECQPSGLRWQHSADGGERLWICFCGGGALAPQCRNRFAVRLFFLHITACTLCTRVRARASSLSSLV